MKRVSLPALKSAEEPSSVFLRHNGMERCMYNLDNFFPLCAAMIVLG